MAFTNLPVLERFYKESRFRWVMTEQLPNLAEGNRITLEECSNAFLGASDRR